MAFNFNNADILIEEKNKMYSEAYNRLYSIYDRAYDYNKDDCTPFRLSIIDLDTIDFWLDYITSPDKYLDSRITANIARQLCEIMIAISDDTTNIEFNLKYKPRNWIFYLDQYNHYLINGQRKRLFKSKEDMWNECKPE